MKKHDDWSKEEDEDNESRITEVEIALDGKKYYRVRGTSTIESIVIASSAEDAEKVFSHENGNDEIDWYIDEIREVKKEDLEAWERGVQ